MSAPDYRSTTILTEHLGYPPIAVIDDVINAVNELMYKCTQAVETYLHERESKRLESIKNNVDNDDDVVMTESEKSMATVPEDEIEMGTAKLETLLESTVDKNFDKFELYAIRNILNVPSELAHEGWIRLNHHKGIDFSQGAIKSSRYYDVQIDVLRKEINAQLTLRKILKLQIVKATKIVQSLAKFKQTLRFLDAMNGTFSSEATAALRAVSPLDETLHYLLIQVDGLFTQVASIRAKLDGEGGVRSADFVPSPREEYLNQQTAKVLLSMGLLPDIMHVTSNLAEEDVGRLAEISRVLKESEQRSESE
ncbi:hypothetical protein BABINDRAFT_159080 [Babjeviella inositovora NRRL Y-12698]|uniref:Kinetochore-associated protein MTW1 n=1 Tax=Babjeviella inositovora NRRL Y-12698 TaxID=984486 RepID=A0A1E3QY39_9ASCO|nr:uncharacterized protein BABINDRAFT_159080 [Babjeviella inositovora NRRL Y-12698]ODQ82504.1 hypothetical protein BABINDRAFT_159080 [Babjeviella inositovora NRRL Y-12698]